MKLKKNLKACINNHKIIYGLTSHLKTHERSKTFSEPYLARIRSESTSVLLYYWYIWKHNTYKLLYLWKPENSIYWAHTGIDLGISNMGDASCRHPNHSSRAIISYTASVEWKYYLPLCDLYHRSSIGARSTT